MSIKFQHYDIEVLRNIYTIATFQPYEGKKGTVDVFYFTKDINLFKSPYGDLEIDGEKYVSHKKLLKITTAHILKHNPIFKGDVRLYNISKPDGAYHLLKTFGISNNSNNTYSTDDNKYKYLKVGDKLYPIERFVRDTDPEFEKTKFPFLVSYNGYQYDTMNYSQPLTKMVYSKLIRIVPQKVCAYTTTNCLQKILNPTCISVYVLNRIVQVEFIRPIVNLIIA